MQTKDFIVGGIVWLAIIVAALLMLQGFNGGSGSRYDGTTGLERHAIDEAAPSN